MNEWIATLNIRRRSVRRRGDVPREQQPTPDVQGTGCGVHRAKRGCHGDGPQRRSLHGGGGLGASCNQLV